MVGYLGAPNPAAEPASPTVAAVLKEFAKSHSTGSGLPRVLGISLDAAGEMVKSGCAARGFGLGNAQGRHLDDYSNYFPDWTSPDLSAKRLPHF